MTRNDYFNEFVFYANKARGQRGIVKKNSLRKSGLAFLRTLNNTIS